MLFHAADFELFQPRFQADPEWNGRRLDLRHRLQEVGEAVRSAYRERGIGLDRRESLHHPHASNGKRVRRQRTMLFRDKAARRSLQRFLGKELGRDLDSARNNTHLQVGIDLSGLWWGLRIDPGAWYDLNALLKLAEEEPGRLQIVAACRVDPPFVLEVDRRGPRPLAGMGSRDWRDLAGLLRPGESGIDVIQRLPAEEAIEAGDLGPRIVAELLALGPLFQLACWSLDGPSGASL